MSQDEAKFIEEFMKENEQLIRGFLEKRSKTFSYNQKIDQKLKL